MKSKLVGFCEMKKKKGKVIFLVNDGQNGVVGQSVKVEYLYNDLSDKVTNSNIGKEIQLVYTAGYNGKAYVSDVVFR